MSPKNPLRSRDILKNRDDIRGVRLALMESVGFTREEFARARKNLGEYVPQTIEIVDQLPMTPTGKISKVELKQRESAWHARAQVER